MSYDKLYDDALGNVFQKRIIISMVRAAKEILADVKSDKTLAVFRKRSTLAYRVLNGPEGLSRQFALASVSAGTLDPTTAVDGDIQWTVNSLWDAFAGVDDVDRTTLDVPA